MTKLQNRRWGPPHYVVDIADGDRNVAIRLDRVGVKRVELSERKTYIARFIGKKVGAIGKSSRFEVTVRAFNKPGASAALYETHEHIEDLTLTEVST